MFQNEAFGLKVLSPEVDKQSMDLSKIRDLVDLCDQDLRGGRGHLVEDRISKLVFSQLPREVYLPVAAICRRAGLFSQGLRLLTPLIHPDGKNWKGEGGIAERSEYAALLTKYGSVGEGLKILNQLDSSQLPEISLYRAFCYIAQWDYRSSIKELKNYLSMEIPDYQAMIARVNLASSLIAAEELPEALDLLNSNINICLAKSYTRLMANNFEMRAQVFLKTGHLAECRADISKSSEILGREQSLDQLFVQKWSAVLEAFESRQIQPLKDFRIVAGERKHWETVRDLDGILLRFEFDDTQFQHLVFGTPFASFKERVYRELGQAEPAGLFVKGSSLGLQIILESGKLNNDSSLIIKGQNLKVLSLFLKDFYRPVRISEIFSSLFPDAYFDIFTSPNRVQKVIQRFRKYIQSVNLPIEIHQIDGFYRLKLIGEIGFQVRINRSAQIDPIENQLRNQFSDNGFSGIEAQHKLGISRQNFQRWYAKAHEQGKILKLFGGAATYYKMLRRTG